MKRNFLEEEHIRRLFIWEVSARERWSVGLFWFSCSPTPPLSTGLDTCWTTPESSAYIWTLPHTNIQLTNIKHTDWHFIASTDVTFHHKSHHCRAGPTTRKSKDCWNLSFTTNFRSNYFLYKLSSSADIFESIYFSGGQDLHFIVCFEPIKREIICLYFLSEGLLDSLRGC